jgi:predicted component of type VI protein secretion system
MYLGTRMGCFYLEITRGLELGRRFPLPDGAITIGRSSQNSIALQQTEKSVSGHHVIIYKSPERIMVQDLQSTNGTFVNETKITEQEITAGDELGFGKAGPRLKLFYSDSDIDFSAPNPASATGTRQSTRADTLTSMAGQKLSGDALRRRGDFPENDASDTSHVVLGSGNPSLTMEFSQKLAGKNLEAGDMQKLMKDGNRLERVLEQGNIGRTQTNMLRIMFDANRNTRRKWLYLVFAIVVVSVAVATFFAVRAYQYSQLLNKAQTIKKDLDEYDKKIAAYNSDPEANKAHLQKLIKELEAKEQSLSSIQSRINQEDFGKFYSDPVERSIDQILRQFGESDYHIPKEMMERVKYHIKVYSVDMHGMMAHYIKRKEVYFPMIMRTFKEKNVPIQLAYVSMLESGFNPNALSSVGARGLWQFMPYTGRHYKLIVDGNIDERTDPEKATAAAAQYFKELIGIFGGKSSVMLCMGAYNAGEGRIMNALRKIDDPMRNRDFWYIYRMGYLPDETAEYIPRVIALMIISENPKQYGFTPSATSETATLESANDFVEVQSKRDNPQADNRAQPEPGYHQTPLAPAAKSRAKRSR